MDVEQSIKTGFWQTAPLALVMMVMPVAPFIVSPLAFSETVRIEDVGSSILKAGLEAANEGRLDAAERFFQAYILDEPESASGFSNLGNVHLQMGYAERALQDFTKAISLAPEAPVPHLNRAIAFEQVGLDAMKSGDEASAARYWNQAIDDCNYAIGADPSEFAAYFDRGNVQMRLENWEDASESFAKAADLAPGLAGYRLRSAALLFQCGNDARAEQQLKGLVRKYGNYAEAHAALAAVQWDAGKIGLAEEQLARALEIDSNLWSNIESVQASTRWPPKLYEAYTKLLGIRI